MAIAHFNVAIVGRSSGKSSVHAAAYASRSDLVDERTGELHRYARKGADIVASWVWLPKGAPERLRDRAALWNAVEMAETRKNSQLARRIILALPHELTTEQQEQLLKDYVRENFTRKGLAADVNIHKPDPKGDERNFHAHILIPTRFIDKAGIGKKDRDSNAKDVLQAWRKDWEKKVNKQLERYGHETRISMDSLEAQGVDRTPQIHLGQGASALDRKGIETDRAEQLRQIANDNDQRARVANDNERTQDYTAGRDFAREVVRPETMDRDRQTAEWQEKVDAAAIAYAEEQQRRQAFMASQAAERARMEQYGQEMAGRHVTGWTEALQRHAQEMTSGYQPGSATEAAEATATGFSFFLSLFTSWADSITRSVTGSKPGPKKPRRDKEKERREQEQKERQLREMEELAEQQALERQRFEKQRAEMMREQERARGYFEQEMADKSSLSHEFGRHKDTIDAAREREGQWEPRRVEGKEKGPQRGGPELGG